MAIVPAGIFTENPITGEQLVPVGHPVLKSEATFSQTLATVKQIGAKKTILTHIEEPTKMNFDDLQKLEQQLAKQGVNIQFAYDTMRIAV